MYMFTTPTVNQSPIGQARLFYFYHMPKGLTVLKIDGVYYETLYPNENDFKTADLHYHGGTDNIVSDEEAADLVAAGYTVTPL